MPEAWEKKEVALSAKLTNRHIGDVTIVDISGKITLGDGAVSLRDNIRALVANGWKKIVLNMDDTAYIDSSGIAELVSGFTRLSNLGGRLVLLSLTQRVRDLLQMTKQYTVFQEYHSEEEAVASFE